MGTEVGKDQITVSTSSIGFTVANVPASAVYAVLSLSPGARNILRVGSRTNAPTSTEGLQLWGGAAFGILGHENILDIRFIRDSLSDGTIIVDARFFSTYDVPVLQQGVVGKILANADANGLGITGNDSFLPMVLSVPGLYNGATGDMQRNNSRTAYLASAARTATTNGADRTNYNFKGLAVLLNVTAITATPAGLTVAVQAKDDTSGGYQSIATAAAAKSTTGQVMYVLYPTAENAEGWTEHWNQVLGTRTYRVIVTHSSADSATYSMDVHELIA